MLIAGSRCALAAAVCVLAATRAVQPVAAQALTGADLVAEVGASAGGGVSGPSTTRANWFAGATASSALLPLGRSWDFSVAARLAREQSPAMTTIGDRIAPAYLDAMRASASLVFVHASGPFDVAIVGRYAETRIDSEQRLPPVVNDNGLWTFLFDATAHLRLYLSRSGAVPPGVLRSMPWLDIYGGVRHDRRYHRNGDLEPYDDPTGRVLGGVFISVWQWRGPDGTPIVLVGGGGDFETALRAGVRLPSAGRAYLRADMHLRSTSSSSR